MKKINMKILLKKIKKNCWVGKTNCFIKYFKFKLSEILLISFNCSNLKMINKK